MELTIERSKWLRGEGSAVSSLYRPKDQKMCCLGFVCIALGLSKDFIANRLMPGGLYPRLPGEFPAWLVSSENESDVSGAANVNDDTHVPEPRREAIITEIFARNDIQVRFVD